MTLEDKLSETTDRLKNLQLQMQHTRKEYVFALQSAIRMPLNDNNNFDVLQVKLIGGDVVKKFQSFYIRHFSIEDVSAV